jgi:hypothetical protein
MPKTHHTQHRIEEVLENLTPQQAQTVEHLRQLVKAVVPQAQEIVRQGSITFRLEDRDFVWVTVAKSHVDLEFAMGSSLSSPLLKTRGVAEENSDVRHVEVNNFVAVEAELKRLVQKATFVGFEYYQKV